MAYIFEECLNRMTIFKSIFSHLSGAADMSMRTPSSVRVSESTEAVEALLTILKYQPSLTTDRLCALLNRNESEIVPILKMLAIRGLVSFDGKNIQLL
jgi:hypothetical protein